MLGLRIDWGVFFAVAEQPQVGMKRKRGRPRKIHPSSMGGSEKRLFCQDLDLLTDPGRYFLKLLLLFSGYEFLEITFNM